MSRVADIRRSVDDYRTAGLITGVLQEISASKMQELRGQFERNARFFSGIREVYGIVKSHALEMSVNTAPAELPPKKDIYIGLTSNKRFSGTLNRDIVRAFVPLTARVKQSDFLMIGLTGAQHLEETDAIQRVERVSFSDDVPNQSELAQILGRIKSYAHVYVVYPKFVNPFRQDIVMTDITETPAAEVTPEMKADYIFEPEIPGMLAFFESQVRQALFERIMLETELARAAARTMKMRDSSERAQTLRRLSERTLMREFATLADIQLMETFIGFTIWKNESHDRV